eukprot:gene4223-4923_t
MSDTGLVVRELRAKDMDDEMSNSVILDSASSTTPDYPRDDERKEDRREERAQEEEGDSYSRCVTKKIVFKKSPNGHSPLVTTPPRGQESPTLGGGSIVLERTPLPAGANSSIPMDGHGYYVIRDADQMHTVLGMATRGDSNFAGVLVGSFKIDWLALSKIWRVNAEGSTEVGPATPAKSELLARIRDKMAKAVAAGDDMLANLLRDRERVICDTRDLSFKLPGGVLVALRNDKWELLEAPFSSATASPVLVPQVIEPMPPKPTIGSLLSASVFGEDIPPLPADEASAMLEVVKAAVQEIDAHFGRNTTIGEKRALGDDSAYRRVAMLVRGKLASAVAAVLAHGFRAGSLFGRRAHIWHFIEASRKSACPSSIAGVALTQAVATIERQEGEIWSDPNVKYRTFICLALNSGMLESWMVALPSANLEATLQHYDAHAFLRNNDLWRRLCHCLVPLSSLPFKLSVDYENAKDNFDYLQAECSAVDVKEKTISCVSTLHDTKPFKLNYDHLVIGVGARNNTFGIPGVEKYSHFLKELNHARLIRQRIIYCFEMASLPDVEVEERRKLLSFVVVGGGPTGVEFCAELNDLLLDDVSRLFPHVPITDVKITLLEASPNILGAFDATLINKALTNFKKSGVDVRTSTPVKEVHDGHVVLKDGKEVPFGLLVWSTGIGSTKFVESLAFDKDRVGRIMVDDHLKVKAIEGVYSFGDCANEGHNLPATAQVAQQQGYYLAEQFNAIAQKKETKPFVFHFFGILAYIGRRSSLFQTSTVHASGFGAWIAWRSAYLTRLGSLRSKFQKHDSTTTASTVYKYGSDYMKDSPKVFTKSSNEPLKIGEIAEGVETIIFRDRFNQPLQPKVFPASLISLTFGNRFNQPLQHSVLPNSLTSLDLGGFNQPLVPGVLPESLTTLTLGDFNSLIVPGVLPLGLTTLTFGNEFDKQLNHLPICLTTLTLGNYSNSPIAPGELPASLTSLTFGYFFNQPITPGVLPSGLTSLTFKGNFNQPITHGVLPDSLTSLTFGYDFNQPLSPGALPCGLTSLTLGENFNQPIVPGALPMGIKTLTFFGLARNVMISPASLPPSLIEVTHEGVEFQDLFIDDQEKGNKLPARVDSANTEGLEMLALRVQEVV